MNQVRGDEYNNIGWDLHQGLTSGTPDPDAAIPWYEKAIEEGSVRAMLNLGSLYEDMENYEDAYFWYLEAALQGNDEAALQIAGMYYDGNYVDQDYYRAYQIFSGLIERGMECVSFYMGFYLEYGLGGCKKDEEKAVEWYRRGIRAHDTSCMVQLGRAYSLGIGLKKDEKKGFHLYKAAADNDDRIGCLNVGSCYLYGQGTKIDYEKALYYYRRGSDLGNRDCTEAISWMAEHKLI